MDSIGLNADHLGQMGDLLVEPSSMLSSMVVYTLVGSALGFQCYNSALNFVPAPEKYASEKRFKWRNVMTSFAHALISGSVAVYCLVMYPHLRADMLHATADLPNLLLAFSCGYFLYDMADLLIYGNLANILPLLLHHVLVLTTFGYLYYHQYCIPCVMVALLVEVNSIFLHGRQVAVMVGIDKSTPFFIALNSANIVTYIFMSFLRWPEVSADMINFSNSLMELMVALSVGYFTYDLLDLLYYKGFQSSWSLVLHHVVIMLSFSIALCTHKYIGYAICALIGEVNSIFLHARQLMLMMNYSKSCRTYQVNGIVNIITFILFRFGVIYHMSCWLYNHTHLIPPVLVGVATFGLIAMFIINVVLFYRLIQSDYLQAKNDNTKGSQDILSN